MEMEKRHCAQSSIPEEIVHDIFSWLPLKSLIRFKCVSRFYNSLVFDPSFIDIHEIHPNKTKFLAWSTDQMKFYHIDLKVEHRKASVLPIEELDGIINFRRVGTIKGLFFLWRTTMHPPVIYNPTSRKVRSLPCLNLECDTRCFYYYSFGFDPDEKKYKILMLTDIVGIHPKRYWVLTLDTSESWREIKSAHSFTPFSYKGGVCIDGTIYFFGFYNDRIYVIVAFNVKTENFRIVSLWEDVRFDIKLFDLMELEGKLAAMYIKDWKKGEINLWILDQRSDIGTEDWVKHTIAFPQSLPFSNMTTYSLCKFCGGSTPDGEIVLTNFVLKPNWIFFYNLKKKSWRETEITNVLPEKVKTFGVYCYVESLLSLGCA